MRDCGERLTLLGAGQGTAAGLGRWPAPAGAAGEKGSPEQRPGSYSCPAFPGDWEALGVVPLGPNKQG